LTDKFLAVLTENFFVGRYLNFFRSFFLVKVQLMVIFSLFARLLQALVRAFN